MKRTTRPRTLLLAAMLLGVTSASVAAANEGTGPLGVTTQPTPTARNLRVGALFDSDHHFCTASVVHSEGHDLIVTAAHCVDDAGGLTFVPGYRDGRAPYGSWTVTRTYVTDDWKGGQDEDSDIAFAVVAPRDGRNVEDVVGANRFAAGRTTGASVVTVTGYPNSADSPISCTNRPTAHSRTQQRIDCPDFTSGTSGSPWINGYGEVVGVLGGHEAGGTTPDISYSVTLGTAAETLYREAVDP